ncbi:MAG: cytochrome c biogenesis protein CcdA [Phycisphaerae bacterium]|nr:cytochrome c biogenesis protein CcdA [Phycisphaerae bacterium]MDD5381472.1 cytochrome c biogenesis protein CcdA [Phycisphaerae bacterium]
MREKAVVFLCLILFFVANALAAPPDSGVIKTDVVAISIQKQHEVVAPNGKSAMAVHFKLKKDWHFYASAESAPGGVNLELTPSSKQYLSFSEPMFPKPHSYFDKSSDKNLDVFSNEFTVFLPFSVSDLALKDGKSVDVVVQISIKGAVCSDVQCRMPDFGQLSTDVKIADSPMGDAEFILPEAAGQGESVLPGGVASYSLWFALGLAFLAGLSLNIMPCVWPVLPLAVLRIVEQAKSRKGAKLTAGLSFCLGILLFFACLVVANIVLHVAYGRTLQWGDQLRDPTFVSVLALILVVLALFMFDAFSFVLPASVSGKTGSGSAGTIGMGFLAAVLSTPCSFGILAAAFAWAQAQPLLPAAAAIMAIGIGMAVPYLVLVSIPGLLDSLPKPGKWMDIFKKTVGFILLGFALWMITISPQQRRTGLLFYSVILAFCVWMWGGWVNFDSKTANKIIVRIVAILLAVSSGFWLLSAPAKPLVDWKVYDAGFIEKSIADNKPVLIKFTADWCLSCKAVERLVYERKDIADLIKQKAVVAVKADTTAKDYPATKALKDIYNEPGVPVSMLFLPGQKEPVRWRDKTFGDELKTLLEKLP